MYCVLIVFCTWMVHNSHLEAPLERNHPFVNLLLDLLDSRMVKNRVLGQCCFPLLET